MKFCVEWTMFLRVSNAEKCERVIGGLKDSAGLPSLEMLVCENYWKDKKLFRVVAVSCVDASTTRDAFFSIMQSANRIARQWIVRGPSSDGDWELAGTAESTKIVEPAI